MLLRLFVQPILRTKWSLNEFYRWRSMIRIQYERRGGSERNRRPHEVWCISNYSAIPLTLSGGVNQSTWSCVPRENSMTSPQAIPVVMNIMTTVNVTRKHAIAWDMGSTEKTCINYAGTLSWNANNYNSKTLEELAWIPQQGLDQTKEIRKSSTET